MHARHLVAPLAAWLALGMDPDPPTALAGLKEALRVSARNAVALTSRSDGFAGNPAIRIAIPESARQMARGLRQMGLKGQVQEFEVALNRAAETAAGESFDVLAGAIEQLKPGDARAILAGGERAATEYFRSSASEELRARFAPLARRGMRRAGLVQAYDRLLQHWRAMPEASAPQLDLEQYVTDEALDGLFLVMGEQERKIRRDPAARSSELLRRTFGARPASQAPVGQRQAGRGAQPRHVLAERALELRAQVDSDQRPRGRGDLGTQRAAQPGDGPQPGG
jgi:hypothetical protein